MSSRDQILGRIRAGLGRATPGPAARAAVEARLAAHPAPVVPARGQLPTAERLALFETMAVACAATLVHVGSEAGLPAAIADYLTAANLPARVKAAPALKILPWDSAPLLSVAFGAALPADLVSVTPVLGAVAETGSLVLRSGADSPTGLNFLPDVHIAVVRASQVVGTYEEVWAALRKLAGKGRKKLPRTVNIVTGPSRTGDIEQTIQLGAHGPRRLHILLVDDVAPSP